ncbi:MAG: ribosome small subunit-dependent GTPase A [Candidatus Saccharimonadales bacterium]
MITIEQLGWNEDLRSKWDELDLPECVPARIVADYGSFFRVAMPEEVAAEISGKLKHDSDSNTLPKIGDWIALQIVKGEKGLIQAVLPRVSEISRKQPGKKVQKQVLAANVNIAFLVQALDADFSPERIERYLFQLSNQNIEPVIVLNKSDKVSDYSAYIKRLEPLGVKIITISALEKTGIDEVIEVMAPGTTSVLLGSSGVGKSTLTNTLLGEDKQLTKDIREEDSKGRHTTTHRELFVLPHGGLLIDTPGIRELQLWGTQETLDSAYPEIEEIASRCRFSNCGHTSEPGCAIRRAIENGTLSKSKLDYYYRLQNELEILTSKVDNIAALERQRSQRKHAKRINEITDADDYM